VTVGSRPLRVTKSGELIELHSPGVGVFTPAVSEDQLVSAGQVLGVIETLGVVRELCVPTGVTGRVRSRAGSPRVRVPVSYGETLVTLSVADLADASVEDAGAEADSSALAFTAPMSGRFYGRPSPEEPPFVVAGATVTRGQTVGLLEVMKTFNRLVYQGDALPETARVVAVVPDDGDDVTRGDAILRLDSDGEA
jgi:acetyl-CoA carboxylase biotin carboxyl carrier protein